MQVLEETKLTREDKEAVDFYRSEMNNLPKEFTSLVKRVTLENFLDEGYRILKKTKKSNEEIKKLLVGAALTIPYPKASISKFIPAELKDVKKQKAGKLGFSSMKKNHPRKFMKVSSSGGLSGSTESKQDANIASQISKTISDIKNDQAHVGDAGMNKDIARVFNNEIVTLYVANKDLPKLAELFTKSMKDKDIKLQGPNNGHVKKFSVAEILVNP